MRMDLSIGSPDKKAALTSKVSPDILTGRFATQVEDELIYC